MAFANALLLSSSVPTTGSYLNTFVGRKSQATFEVVGGGATFAITWKAKAAGSTGSQYDITATNVSSSALSLSASISGLYRIDTTGIEVTPKLASVSGGTVVVYGTNHV